MAVERIVSLIPSGTEMVYQLGFGERLMGRSHECDVPESVLTLPALTRPRVDPSAPSGEIDRQVNGLLQQGQPLYEVDSEALRRLDPQLIVTQGQCDVCAVSFDEVEALRDRHMPACRLTTLQAESLNGVWQDILRVATVLEAVDRGLELVTRLKQRMAELRSLSSSVAVKPRVACVEWVEPLMVSGNWVPELVETAGGMEPFGLSGKPSREMGWGEFAKADPDVIVVFPCGMGIDRARAEMATLSHKPYWKLLKAVRGERVYLADGNRYFNRPGPGLVRSAEILAEILHPEIFPQRFQGEAWEKY